MENKTTLRTHNEILPLSEPWHRGSGFTWMLLALAGLVLLSGAAAKAQTTYNWRSEATSGNWNWNNSWWNGSSEGAPTGNDVLRFNNNTQTSNENNLSSTSRYRVFFDAGATTGRTVSGSTENTFFDYGGNAPKIENNSSGAHILNFPIKLGAGMQVNPVSGNLTLGGAINLQSHYLDVYGDNQNTLRINGTISGAGGINLQQNSTLEVAGDNSYSGNTTINAGKIKLISGGDFGSSLIQIGANGQLDLNNVSTTVAGVKEVAYGNGGSISLGSGTLTINGTDKGTLSQSSISGTGGLTMSGSGTTLALYGSQSYSGATTVSAGKITTSVALASTSLTVNGGTLETTADGVIANNASTTLSSGTFHIGGNDTIGSVTATGGRLSVTNAKTAYLTNGASSIGAGAKIVGGTLQVQSGSSLALNSDDSENTSAITVASGGTLSGSGTTTGALSVSGVLAPGNSTGILDVGSTTFLGGGNYDWEIDNFTGFVGTNWDLLEIAGDLTISVDSESKFIIDVISLLSASDTEGEASNFNANSNYTFAIATASGTINNYSAGAFDVRTTGFRNSFTGTWGTSLSEDGKSLNITYTATTIPEPSSASMLVLGLAAVLSKRRRVARG